MELNTPRAVKFQASNGAVTAELEKRLNHGHRYSVSVADWAVMTVKRSPCMLAVERDDQKRTTPPPCFISWLSAANEGVYHIGMLVKIYGCCLKLPKY